MKLHFINSAHVNAPERVVSTRGRFHRIRPLQVRYGLLEHPKLGPILIDTGYDAHVTTAPGRSFALRAYAAALRPKLCPQGEIETILGPLGYGLADVHKIIVTHFHADHVSALRRFPNAEILTDKATLTAVLARSGFANLRHGIFAELLPDDLLHRTTDMAASPAIDAPLHLGRGFDILGDGSVIALPLPGHAEGHFGLCFPSLDPVLLYACDVQWMPQALTGPGRLALLARLISHDTRAARHSSDRVAAFHRAGGAVVLCHDPDPTPYDLAGQTHG